MTPEYEKGEIPYFRLNRLGRRIEIAEARRVGTASLRAVAFKIMKQRREEKQLREKNYRLRVEARRRARHALTSAI